MKICVVGPSFFGYASAISDTYNELGNTSVWKDEFPKDSFFLKAYTRLANRYTHGYQFFSSRLKLVDDINSGDFDLVVLINPEYLNADCILKIRKPKTIYFWDSIGNKPNFIQILRKIDAVSSFDPRDCNDYKINYIPLFAESIFHPVIESREIDISLIGTAHSMRIPYACMLVNSNYKNYVHLYTRNLITYLYSNPIKNWVEGYSCCTSRKMSKAEVADVFTRSKVVLDIPHPNQIGHTSRVFEAIQSGAILLTTSSTKMPNHEMEDRTVRINSRKELFIGLRRALSLFDSTSIPRASGSVTSIERFCSDLLAAPRC